MHRFIRWAALALFCAAWGFAGAFGAVFLMSERLEGTEGPPGARGEPGPPGPDGAVPDVEVLAAILTKLQSRLSAVEDVERDLGIRLTNVESRELSALLCGVGGVEVVTDVRFLPNVPEPANLWVDRALLCVE